MPDDLPETLAFSATRKPGVRPAQQRRARSNVPGVRAETLPAIIPGEKIFRVVPDNATLRSWGRRRGYRVAVHGKIPEAVRVAFAKENAWTVRVVSAMVPGDTQFRQFYQVRQGPYIRKMTTDPFYVKRELGDELFSLLKEV